MDSNTEIAEIKDQLAKVSKAAHEYEAYKKDRAIRVRDWIIGILLFLLIASNIAWALFESSMETVTETTETVTIEGVEQTADNSGVNNNVGGDYSYGG